MLSQDCLKNITKEVTSNHSMCTERSETEKKGKRDRQTAGCNRNVQYNEDNKNNFTLFSKVNPLCVMKCFLKGPTCVGKEQHYSFFTLKAIDYLGTFLVNSREAANEKAQETNCIEAKTTSL